MKAEKKVLDGLLALAVLWLVVQIAIGVLTHWKG